LTQKIEGCVIEMDEEVLLGAQPLYAKTKNYSLNVDTTKRRIDI